MLMSSLVEEDKDLHFRTKSQKLIFKQYLSILFKTRFKNYVFLFGELFAIALLILAGFVIPTKPNVPENLIHEVIFNWKDQIISEPAYYLRFQDISAGLYPNTDYTKQIKQEFDELTYLNNTITIFDNETSFNEFASKNLHLHIRFDNNSNNYNISGGQNIVNNFHIYTSYIPISIARSIFNNITNYKPTYRTSNMTNPYTSGDFDDNPFGNYIAVIVQISALLPIMAMVAELVILRSKKNYLLLMISGAKELTLILANLLSDLLFVALNTIITTAALYNHMVKGSSLLLIFLIAFSFNFSIYALMLSIVPIFKKEQHFMIVANLFFVIPIMLFNMIGQQGNKIGKTLGIVLKFLSMFPFVPFQSICTIFNNLLKYNIPLTFSNWSEVSSNMAMSTCVMILFILVFIYFFLFVFFNLMCSRANGMPPIGFRNIFSGKHWKRLFRRIPIQGQVTNVDEMFISVSNISKTYNGKVKVHALDDVSFGIQSGEVIILIGPNGSGKTTLMNCMTGCLDCDEGRIKLFGEEAALGFSDLQSYLGICFQENVVFNNLSVENHLNFFGSIRGLIGEELKNEVQLCIDKFGLSECKDNYGNKLSGGQARKLCIALAFIGSPEFVILDEPTAGIDVTTRQAIWKAISTYKSTSLISSHSLEEAESVSNRLFVLRSGKLIFDGSSSELRRKYHCGYVLTPAVIKKEQKDQVVEKLFKFCSAKFPEATIDDSHKDHILLPVASEIVPLLEEIEARKEEFGISGFNIVVDQLENVLYRMYIEDENAIN